MTRFAQRPDLAAAIDLRFAPFAALLLRLAIGTVFIAHALMKLFVYTLPGTAQFLVAHDLPGWAAYPLFAGELTAGVLLLLGVYTRLVALSLLPVMAGAFTVHWPNGWSFDASGGGWEYVAFLSAALVAQAGLGAGAFAVSIRRGRRQAAARVGTAVAARMQPAVSGSDREDA